jgi:hypothetical protein
MGTSKAIRLGSSICLLALTGCGGGGGGSTTPLTTTPTPTTPTNTAPVTTTPITTTPITPTVSIGAPDQPNVTIQGTPTFNFSTNFPPVGTIMGLIGPAVKITSTTVEAANRGTDGTIIYRGMVTSGGKSFLTFDIKIPAIGLNATNVLADSNIMTLPDGGKVALAVGTLNYTLGASWTYTPAGSTTRYEGVAATGSGTPLANVPTTGSGTYSGTGANGGTVGFYYVPNGSGGILSGSLVGDIAITANFSTGGVTGTLSNMKAYSSGGAATPWNSVTLSATISRSAGGAAFNGTTSTSNAPADAGIAGFSSAATGTVVGGFFGPNVDEVGGTWSLVEPNATGGGKTAYGDFAAACSGCNPSPPPPPPAVSIAAPGLGIATFSGGPFGTSFTSNPPTIGTQLPLGGSTAAITPTSVADFSAGPISATYRGTVPVGGVNYPVFDLSIPSLSLTAANLRGDGMEITLPDGGKVSAAAGTMSYTLLGAWGYIPASGNKFYLGQVVTGYGTPTGGVPTSGTANYSGAVIGAYAVPSGTNAIELGTLSGDVSLNLNFAGNTTAGSFTNMKAKVAGSATTTPWNTLSLSGTLTRGANAATLDGPITTTSSAGTAGFSSAATGGFHGALYGPTAQEVGGTWRLSESTTSGGKAAFGTFGAHQ